MRLSITGNKLARRDETVVGEIENISLSLVCPNCGKSFGVGGSAVSSVVLPTTEPPTPETPTQASMLPDPINETWDLYVTLLERPKAVLTPKVRRWIAEAHAAAGVEQTQMAILGLATSDFHRMKGYTGIEYAIRPRQNETIEGRIAMMVAYAPAEPEPGPNGLLSVQQLVERFGTEMEDTVWGWIDDINQWAARPHIDVLETRAHSQIERLRKNGYEPVVEGGRIAGFRVIET
jgi:hypothetical protein